MPTLLYAWWVSSQRKKDIGKVLLGFLPMLIWELFSLFYFGFPFPNTAYAKLNTGISNSLLILQGLDYFLNAINWDPVTVFGILLAGFALYLVPDKKFLTLFVGVLLYLAYIVWIGGDSGNDDLVRIASLAYMFFSWLAWPIWVPFSTYFLEPLRRKPLYLVMAIIGAILGAGQYLPYLVHNNWLSVKFLDNAIVYDGVELFDFIFAREITYLIYLATIIVPALVSTKPEIRVFGILIAIAFAVTYAFFAFAYISVFCFSGALMSLYLVAMIFWIGRRRRPAAAA